ncbi:cutinase family protein [Nocardia sp. NPDC127579]|uniref:cutinase family protein n=1 Tax=Nocardia sp. NPDC127579 TaxID=3345402 RepID=UPI003644AFE1
MLSALAVAVAFAAAAPATAQAPAPDLAIAACPALYALGIQGTGQSSPDAAPTIDTGMLSTVFRPLLAKAPDPGLVERAYVPYESGFGGFTAGGPAPYIQSVTGGLERLRAMARSVVERCAATRLAIVGYSQGAHVASLFAQEVGQGQGVVAPDKIAAVALFGDPTRNPGAALFPGSPGRTTPDAAPDTEGVRVATVAALNQTPATGGGIAPDRDQAENFAALTGRVASFCTAGDLSCDAPEGAPILRAVANIAGQAQVSGGDPITALVSVAQALAYTSIKAASTVVEQDVSGNTLANLSLSPRKSISERLADASDPRAPIDVDVDASFHALLRVGLIGLNAVVTVVKAVIDPATIAQLGTAGLSNPVAGLALLGAKLIGAVPQLVPPTTISRLVTQAYDAVVQNATDNRALLDTTTWVKYWDTVRRHGAYESAAVTATGDAPVRFVADWFAAVARDLDDELGRGGIPRSVSTTPTPGLSVSRTGASATPNDSGTGEFPFGNGATSAPSSGATDLDSTSPPAAVPGTPSIVYPSVTN